MKNKIFSICLVLSIVFGVMPMNMLISSAADSYTYSGRGILVQVEDCIVKTSSWSVSNDTLAAGGQSAKAVAVDMSGSNISSEISIDFNVNDADKYYFWLRYKSVSAAADSLYYAVDDSWSPCYSFKIGSDYNWLNICSFDLESGLHNMSFSVRELSILLDEIIITKDSSFVPTDMYEKLPLVYSNGGIIVEAEDYIVDTSMWNSLTDMDASEEKAALAKKTNNSLDDRTAEISVDFSVSDSAEYYFWIRYSAPSAASDSLFYTIDDDEFTQYAKFTLGSGYSWVKICSSQLTVGSHTVSFLAREYNFKLDQIVITKNKLFAPQGICTEMPDEDNTTIYGSWAIPGVTPPKSHPRVYFTSNDVEELKENFYADENKYAADTVLNDVKKTVALGTSYDESVLSSIESKAYYYALFKDETVGREAVDLCLGTKDWTVPTTGSYERRFGRIVYNIAMVYDWCYDIMTDDERSTAIDLAIENASQMEIGWPPSGGGAVTGHSSENQLLRDLLSFSIAVYNERPDIWNYVGGRFYEEFVPVRQFTLPGHYNNQGTNYGFYRQISTNYAYALITGMGAPEPYSGKDLVQTEYSQFYLMRPDGQFFSDGDIYESTKPPYSYPTSYISGMLIAAKAENDGYLKNEIFRRITTYESGYEEEVLSQNSSVEFLIFSTPQTETKKKDDMPLSKFFDSPVGMMAARTGWDDGTDSNSVAAVMKIGEYQFNNHQHLDSGNFEIYYKGLLAGESGNYSTYGTDEHVNYTKKSVAHNTMLVYNPNASTSSSNRNDGGQKSVNGGSEMSTLDLVKSANSDRSTTMAHEIDPTNPTEPNYTYIKGDLSKAYSSDVENFERSFMFLNLKNDKTPGALIVFDRVVSADETFKKTWLLHSPVKPETDGNTSVFVNKSKDGSGTSYNGKMTVETLLPKSDNLSVETVGNSSDGWEIVNGWTYDTDSKSWIKTSSVDYTTEKTDEEYEHNTYRLEVSPKTAQKENYFLNVISLSDADEQVNIEAPLYESNDFYGTQIDDRVVFFSKDNTLKSSFSYTVSESSENLEYTICGMTDGQYSVSVDGNTQTVYVTSDGGVLHFIASGKNVIVNRVGSTVLSPEVKTSDKVYTDAYIRIGDKFINTTGLVKKTENGYDIPVKAIINYLGYNLEKENETSYLVVNDDGKHFATINTGENEIRTYCGNYQISKDPYINEDALMMNIDDVCTVFECTWNYSDSAQTIYISQPADFGTLDMDLNGFLDEDVIKLTAHVSSSATVDNLICAIYENTDIPKLTAIAKLTADDAFDYSGNIAINDIDLSDTQRYTVKVFAMNDFLVPLTDVKLPEIISGKYYSEVKTSALSNLVYSERSGIKVSEENNKFTLTKTDASYTEVSASTNYSNDHYILGENTYDDGQIHYNKIYYDNNKKSYYNIIGGGYLHYSTTIKTVSRSSSDEIMRLKVRGWGGTAVRTFTIPNTVGEQYRLDCIVDIVNKMVYIYIDGVLNTSSSISDLTSVGGFEHYLIMTKTVEADGGSIELTNTYLTLYTADMSIEKILNNSSLRVFVN